MITRQLIINTAIAISTTSVFGQKNLSSDSLPAEQTKLPGAYKHSIGASLLMISNFFPEPADYYMLTYGYQPSQRNRFFAEFNTWKYSEPIGTYGNSEEEYPGYVREYGIGVGYQRFHWKGVFTTVQATPFLKQYLDEFASVEEGAPNYIFEPSLNFGFKF